MIPFNKIKNNLREKIYYQLCELEDKGYLKTNISSLLITLIYNHLEYHSKTISIKECLIYN